MPDLFDCAAAQVAPGKTDTSRAAAEAIKPRAQTIRSKIAEIMRAGAAVTADEMAGHLALPVLTVRPRFSELRNLGLIEDSGKRRKNRGGKAQIVWAWNEGAA